MTHYVAVVHTHTQRRSEEREDPGPTVSLLKLCRCDPCYDLFAVHVSLVTGAGGMRRGHRRRRRRCRHRSRRRCCRRRGRRRCCRRRSQCGPPPHLAILLEAPRRAPPARRHFNRDCCPVARGRPALHPPYKPEARWNGHEQQSKPRLVPDRETGHNERCPPSDASRKAPHRIIDERNPREALVHGEDARRRDRRAASGAKFGSCSPRQRSAGVESPAAKYPLLTPVVSGVVRCKCPLLTPCSAAHGVCLQALR